MIDIIVVRGEGDVDGGIIENPLTSDIRVALQLGQYLIDKSAKGREVDLSVVYKQGYSVGQLVLVLDSLNSERWVGRLTSLQYSVQDGMPSLRASVWKPEVVDD